MKTNRLAKSIATWRWRQPTFSQWTGGTVAHLAIATAPATAAAEPFGIDRDELARLGHDEAPEAAGRRWEHVAHPMRVVTAQDPVHAAWRQSEDCTDPIGVPALLQPQREHAGLTGITCPPRRAVRPARTIAEVGRLRRQRWTVCRLTPMLRAVRVGPIRTASATRKARESGVVRAVRYKGDPPTRSGWLEHRHPSRGSLFGT